MNAYQHDRALQMPQGETLPYCLRHDPSLREHADRRDDGTVVLRVFAEAGVVRSAEVVAFDAAWPRRIGMHCRHRDPHEEVWESEPIAVTQPITYYVRLQTGSGQALLGRTGLQANLPHEARYRLEAAEPLGVPGWARGAVFYQVFPDRFERGPSTGGSPCDAFEPWDAPPTSTGFKGGTLRGITSRLDAIATLGVDALWLNPVFASPSNHGYDTTDFYAIEPRLGSVEDLQDLVRSAHERGMRVILDGVFNHVSDHHPFFRDVVQRGPDSPYWSWFTVRRWPIERPDDDHYAAWWGHGHLPELDLRHPEVQAYLLEVGRYWVREAGIDGWRLDVAGEVPLAFWRRFRQAVRAEKPDAYLLAEVWGDARPFVQGDTFDATMQYAFRRAVLAFLEGDIDAAACARHLERLYHRLPAAVAQAQYNLLGSHDVNRVWHDLGGERRHVELAFAIQFAFPGVAALYYGDEVGLDGEGDPGCRAAYPWDRAVAHDMRPLVTRLAHMRRAEPALRRGDVRCGAVGTEVLEIARCLAGDVVTLRVDRTTGDASWTSSATTGAARHPGGTRR